jgi:crotonobetainyl-CoA:carnitine CoA-transferase CaiB-like acyl-CoA transferase
MPAPTLGQHNAEIFGEQLGMTSARIEELTHKGVI